MLMLAINYLRIIDCKYDAANRNESYQKEHRSSKRKFLKYYLYIRTTEL